MKTKKQFYGLNSKIMKQVNGNFAQPFRHLYNLEDEARFFKETL